MNYLHWNETTITDFSDQNISDMYNRGYVFTRLGRGMMQQTRSVRIDLSKYSPTSENRRILKKTDGITLDTASLPITNYDFKIGKIAKDFYETKFGPGIMSAQKIKEMLTQGEKSNFNILIEYTIPHPLDPKPSPKAFTIAYKNASLLHYSYPFYDLNTTEKDTGLGMMIRAIEYAKTAGLKYVYLGSLQRPSDTYKLQFEGLEWFDGTTWQTDLKKAKIVLGEKQLPSLNMTNLPKKIHVIGICGVAMSAIAIAFRERGVEVTGSDKGFYPPVSTELEKHNIYFYAGWHPEKMMEGGAPDAIMIGAASGSHNPETIYAKEHDIPMYSFPEMLGKYFVRENSIVCSGTWGKTSSSALLSFILEHAKKDPSYMFGGVSLSHGSSAKWTDSTWSVFEGDEYKSSPTDLRAKFFHYKPTHLLLTAVSWDHADLYTTEDSYFEAFRKLLSGMPHDGLLVMRATQPGIDRIRSSFDGRVVSYGSAMPGKFDENVVKLHDRAKSDSPQISQNMIAPDYTYSDIRQSRSGIDFAISHKGQIFHIHSPLLGDFQAENITGCFALASTMGIDGAEIIEAISLFNGLKRRMEKRFDGTTQGGGKTISNGITVIDDIAHSPEKASSVLKTLKDIYGGKNGGRVFAIFEPNIGGRERQSADKYDGAFVDADTVIIPKLTKLKIATESSKTPDSTESSPMEGDELADRITRTHKSTLFIDDDKALVDYLLANTKSGDVIAFLGSHGFRGMIEAAGKMFNDQ
ncbi:MAG: Mur ligase family protein [Candidatus Taylorbacteria bacterium]